MYPTAKLVLRKIGAKFIITVYLTASANAVPEARSHSPTSSSQALKPDSKRSAWSHQSFAGIMIFCIKGHCRFWVSGATSACVIRRHASAPLDSSTDRTKSSDTAFRYQGQRSSTSVCSIAGVHRPALSLLPGRSDSARFRTCPSTWERLH